MGEVALECRGLRKSFGGVHAVDGLDLSFESGTVTALVGPNGAGKTTLFHLICGALRCDNGDVLYRGRRINGLPPWATARLGIGRLFQDVRVFGSLTVLENLLVGFPDQEGEAPLVALLGRGRVSRREADHKVKALQWLGLVGLADRSSALAGSLSFGQQKLLAIARLLAGGADVLLLDEPTAGVHPTLVDRLLTVIRRLAGEGRTVILIEHNTSVVLGVADWVYFLDEGQVASFGLPAEVLADPSVRAAFAGLGGRRQ